MRATIRRTSGILPLPIGLDPDSDQPLHQQVREALRIAILAGGLAPGARLPASRILAADLGCARGTVLLALEQLAAEGYLTTRTGSGTRVAATLPDDLLVRPRGLAAARKADPGEPILSRRGTQLASASGATPRPDTPDAFALGRPARDAFPFETWAKLLQNEWRHGPATHLHPLGDPQLRRAVAAYLSAGRGVACTEEAVVITGSIRQSLTLVADLLFDPGEAAFVEEPGFPGLAHVLRAAGLSTVPVPVDGAGFSVAQALALAPEARLAVVSPAQAYPLGATMSLENRLALLAWAETRDGWIVEDDYDGEYRYAGRPLAPLQALDRAGRVLYVGSFSKVLLPALQLSYLVLPAALVNSVARAVAAVGSSASILGQGTLARFLEEGHFASHLRRTRRLYSVRQGALIAAAQRHLHGILEIAPLDGGMHLVARPTAGRTEIFDDRRAVAACARMGITAVALSSHFAEEARAEPGLLLGYAAIPELAIEPAVRRMAETLGSSG